MPALRQQEEAYRTLAAQLRYPWDRANGMKGWGSRCVWFAKGYVDLLGTPLTVDISSLTDFTRDRRIRLRSWKKTMAGTKSNSISSSNSYEPSC